ncbi:MAG: CPBP family intramembrane metalloprotease [Nocardiopsaceae bacterium]|nr:CPBP family intramembrane metalloprotease [Nocardiopsaceae bacterium]
MRQDALVRLIPFAALVAGTWLRRQPTWLGVSRGRTRTQAAFGAAAGATLFGTSALLQRSLSRRRGTLRAPGSLSDALVQAAYYALNGPIEEAFFRGLLQGGVGSRLGTPAGLVVGTVPYVLYHRLGGWRWPEVAATALAGVPLALAYRLLPGRPSLLGVSLAHIGATCGFMGPGPWLLRKVGLV